MKKLLILLTLSGCYTPPEPIPSCEFVLQAFARIKNEQGSETVIICTNKQIIETTDEGFEVIEEIENSSKCPDYGHKITSSELARVEQCIVDLRAAILHD